MAPAVPKPSLIPLRVLTRRLSKPPSTQLPYIASILACDISESRGFFERTDTSTLETDSSECGVLIHKLKTQLSAFLQDRSPEVRYAAVILVKATVELGDYDILQGTTPWVKGLINILGRPDAISMKKLCVITLTRIFLLTRNHQSLVRQITTPALAGFITRCVNLAQVLEVPDALRLVILQALNELISLHSTSFRPFLTDLRKLTLSLIAPTPSNTDPENHISPVSSSVSDSARRLFVLLHVCSPKDIAEKDWAQSIRNTLTTANRTSDRIFRAIVEDWRPPPDMAVTVGSMSPSEEVSDRNSGPLDLPSWTGIHAGIERLDGLLRTLQAFLAATTSGPVVLPISSIMDLIERVLLASLTSNTSSSSTRPEIGRDEREGLAAGLPHLHISAMGLLSLMLSRLGSAFAALVPAILEHVFGILDDAYDMDGIRVAVYKVVSQVIRHFGQSIPNSTVGPLSRCISLACQDLLPLHDILAPDRQTYTMNGTAREGTSTNADSYLKSTEIHYAVLSAPTEAQAAAQELIPLALSRLLDGVLSRAVRDLINRTAILANNKEMMLASVMNTETTQNPHLKTTSILPMLARAHSGYLDVEALLRPQFPLLYPRRSQQGMIPDGDEDLYSYNQDRLVIARGGFDQNGFGQNRNESSQKDASEHGDLTMQALPESKEHGNAVSTSKAPFGFQTASTRLPDLHAAETSKPSKRVWEDDVNSNLSTRGSDFATLGRAGPTEAGASGKRPRFSHDDTDRQNETQGTPTHIPFKNVPPVDPPAPGVASAKSSTLVTAGAQFGTEIGSDDDSDFEMPTLHLEPDTDEEIDDEDEEEGEEDGD